MSEGANPSPGEPAGVSRRTALKLIAAGTLGAAAGVGATAFATRLDRAIPPRYFFFSEEEANPLIAMCEQIIPRDDTPGATEAGVIDYIDRQLAGPLSRHQRSYRAGLKSLQAAAIALHKLPFEKLPFADQTALLAMIEKGATPKELWGELAQDSFFNLVLDHTRQGFYGSPRHGGNRGYTSYRMMGLAYPNIAGQNRYARSPGA